MQFEEKIIRSREMRAEADADALAWYCVRSQVKQEHIAAAHMRKMEAIDVFLPRIRFRRATRRGPVWFTEAMFPNYLFARFNWKTSLQMVNGLPGVNKVVHFGDHWPAIPDGVISELKVAVGEEQICIVPSEMAPGDHVTIVGGVFHGLQAIVTQVLPSRERIRVLMEFLGQQTAAELDLGSVLRDTEGRQAVL